MTSGKQKRNRFYTPTPGERQADDALDNLNSQENEWIRYRDNCLEAAKTADRRIESIQERRMALIAERQGKE